jgi:uncharacterized protein (TIGR01244 family)
MGDAVFMQRRILTDDLSVSGQLDADDFALLAQQGVRLVINNRPDGEAPGQLSAAEGKRLAEAAGLAYQHIPVRFPTLQASEIDRFGAAVEQADGPVHAHCASGARSATLWALSQVRTGSLDRAGLKDWAAKRQVDPAAALSWLDRNPG